MSREEKLIALCEGLIYELAEAKNMHLTECESCGRPFFASPGRSQVRKYCSESCRASKAKSPNGKRVKKRKQALILDPCTQAFDLLLGIKDKSNGRMRDEDLRKGLNTLTTRIGNSDGRTRDFYLGAHLALNLLANHEEITGAGEYVALLDEKIEKEMGLWQASTN